MVSPIALALVLVAAQGWRASTAPGPPSQAHAAIADNCDACHMPFKGLPNEKCLGCHKELKQFHTSVAVQKCNACHLEHQGPAVSLTKPAALAAFKHELTAFSLVGAHQKIGCPSCHNKPIAQMTESCAGCHKDTHLGAVGTACAACHQSNSWKPALHLLDEHKLSMEGGHAKTQCVSCHARGKNLTATVGCAACHEQGHGGTTAPCESCHEVKGWTPAKFDHDFCTCILPQKHQTVGCLGCHQDWKFTKTPTLCSGCHEKERKHESLGECSLCHSAVSWTKNTFNHNKGAKLKLTGQHLKVACENCHPPLKAAMKFRGVPLQCEGCHQKKGDEAHGNFGPCAKCHSTDGFNQSTFGHASTGFPLVGKHATLNCKQCHEQKTRDYPKASPKKAGLDWLRGALAWTPTNDAVLISAAPHVKEASCSHCHVDPHKTATTAANECSTCHTSEMWKPSTFAVQRHATTTFPLTGKHAVADCKVCHADSKLDAVPKDCASCHVDRHGGRLGKDCGQCHDTTAFKPVVGFEHQRTGFALVGGHAKLACASCHEGKRGVAMRTAKINATACVTCHQAQHGVELGENCASCHELTKGPFSSARGMNFPHQKTGFSLERRHATLPCGACHPAAGPALAPRCTACHVDPHSGQLGQGCEDCHVPDRFRLVRFDHDRTGWPLRGRHFMAPCASCHVAQRWVGLADECWDCHSSDAARGKMRAPEAHPFGALDCAACHTSMWKW